MKIKSIISLALALAIASAVAMPAFAAQGSGSVKFKVGDVQIIEPTPTPTNPDPNPDPKPVPPPEGTEEPKYPVIPPGMTDYEDFFGLNVLQFGQQELTVDPKSYPSLWQSVKNGTGFITTVVNNGDDSGKREFTVSMTLGKFSAPGVTDPKQMEKTSLSLKDPVVKHTGTLAPTTPPATLTLPSNGSTSVTILQGKSQIAGIRWNPSLDIPARDVSIVGDYSAVLTWNTMPGKP